MTEPANLKITALILARGGSKGITQKNIKVLCGTPLIGWTIRAALCWKRFDTVWVSTDDPQIAHVSEQYGASIHWRNSEVAKDDTPSIDAVKDFIAHHREVEWLALLQCTSPFLQPKFLEKAYQLLVSEKCDSVFAASRKFHLRWIERDSGIAPLNFDPAHRPRRQDWSGELVECGMFYFTRVDFLWKGQFQSGKCGHVEIPEEYSLEIDSQYDWMIAEAIIPKFGYVPPDRNDSLH